MIKLKISLISGLLLIQLIAVAQDNYKRYEIKSAKVEYKTNSSQGVGTKTLIFDDYGMRELTRVKIFSNGKLVVDKLTLLDGKKAYSVDLLTHEATDISSSVNNARMISGNEMDVKGREMLKAMGGKVVRHTNMLGKPCEVWEVSTMGKSTIVMYKGIPLSTKITVMGFRSSDQATSFKENISTASSDFKLPEGVTLNQETDENIGGIIEKYGGGMTDKELQGLEKLRKMSYEQFKDFVKKRDPNAGNDEIKMIYNIMKASGGSKNN